MEAYRSWWRASYSTSPNSQAVVLAAAWAEHVLATYQAGVDQPTAKPINWARAFQWLAETCDRDHKWTDADQAQYQLLMASLPGETLDAGWWKTPEPAAPAQPVGEAS
jgi:hypothetical protein